MYTSPQPVADLPGDRPLADAFISYSRIDLAFALRLEAALIAAGQTVWLDKNDIPAAAPWLPEVQSGIDSADNFVFILSPDSVCSSNFVLSGRTPNSTTIARSILSRSSS